MIKFIKTNNYMLLLLMLLLCSGTVKAQFNENETPPPGFEAGNQLSDVPVSGYVPPDNSWDYPSNDWNYGPNNYIGNNDDYNNQQSGAGGSNNGQTTSGGNGGGGNGANRQTASQVVLTKKVLPGQTHTQPVKVLRDPNTSTNKKVIDLIVNGAKAGTVTFSDPQRDANGVDIYSKMTVEVFSNSPIAITNLTFDNSETSNYNDSQHSTNGNLQVVWADISIYKDLGIVNFTTPINEEEDLVITGSSTAANPQNNKKDPCTVAKELTTLGANPVFKKAVQDIRSTPDFYGKEYSAVLGKNASSQIYAGEMTPGTVEGVEVKYYSVQNFFLNLHNHPNYTIHSGKDLYNMAFLNKLYPNYSGSIVLPGKDEVYAAVITDLAAAQVFAARYLTDPKTKESAHYPKFMYQEMSNVFENLNSYSIESESRAKAFVLDKYNSGVTFFRQGVDGKFYPLKIKEIKQTNDLIKYELIPCS